MNCVIHTETPAVAFCRTCGKALCAACKRDVRGVVFCEDCLANRVEGAIPPGAVPPPPPPMGQQQPLNPNAPNPGVALALGFIPGVGAMYAGEFTKAVFHVLVFASLIWAVDNAGVFEIFFALGIAFWYFYMIFDSYQTAKAKQEGRPVPDPFGLAGWSSKGTVAFDYRRERFPTAAILLIGLGVLFLLGNIFQRDVISRAWPLLLIYFGVVRLMAVRRATLCPCVRCQTSRMMGPAVLLGFGILFLLDQWTDLKFGRTFPAILIVIGAVKLLQAAGSNEGHIENPPPPAVVASTDQQQTAPEDAQGSETRHGY
jgi:LiaF transmembrane domain/B-box zinc finger